MKHARPDYARIQDPAGLIPTDEPVFLIRASDVLGPGIVRLWAEQYRGLSGADQNMARLAWEHAEAMTAWQRMHKPKTPDLPTTPAQERDS